MKAAERYNIRPSALILGKDSRKPWDRWDILLAKAYERFNEELCGQCGMPRYICHSSDRRIHFKLSRDECEANRVAESEQTRLTKAGVDTSGVRLGGEPYLLPDAVEAGLEFVDFRRAYLVEQAKIKGYLPEDYPVPTP
jgi:hypothetical protein